MSDKIAVSEAGGVLSLALDDQTTLNALTMPMVETLIAHLQAPKAGVRTVLLSGRGKAFCSGANLVGGAGTGATGDDAAAPLRTHFDPLIAAIRDLHVPLVVSVRGPAVGYGAALALAGDIVVASETAFFHQAFGRVGLVADGGAAFTLVKSIGRIRATEMMLLGGRITAAKALEWGLVTKVVADATLEDEARGIAETLAQGATLALGRMRQMAWAACSGDLDDAFALEVANQAAMMNTDDHKRALAAFLAKEAPRFEGR
jgi:enoyl-CoA hydratase/carnithine racemase